VEQIEQAEVDDEGLGDIEDDMNGGVEDDAFFEEVMQTEAGEVSLDSSANNILQVSNAIHDIDFSKDLRFFMISIMLYHVSSDRCCTYSQFLVRMNPLISLPLT
jgi:hypothetical protein